MLNKGLEFKNSALFIPTKNGYEVRNPSISKLYVLHRKFSSKPKMENIVKSQFLKKNKTIEKPNKEKKKHAKSKN